MDCSDRLPKIIIDKLTAELNAVCQKVDVRKRLDTFTVEFSGLSGQAFADFARKERETLAPIIERANIKPN
jgi:tripartite-type tricarboxylate transporter receptor subunit TctC